MRDETVHLFIVGQGLIVHLIKVTFHCLLRELDGLIAKKARTRNVLNFRHVILPIIRGVKLQFVKNRFENKIGEAYKSNSKPPGVNLTNIQRAAYS